MRPTLALAAALLLAAGCAPPPTGDTATERPERLVTLAPHLAELVHAAGAGHTLVGVSEYSDFPEAVAALPRIGDAFRVDMERLTRLSPDLVLTWKEGTPAPLVERLRARGFAVRGISTATLDDIPAALRLIGELLGTEERAEAAARDFDAALGALSAPPASGEPLRVFYQVATRPLYTIGGDHYISEALERCGGRSIFADLDELAPVVSVEAVLARDPELILAAATDPAALHGWRRWDSLSAVRNDGLRLLAPDTLARPAPRVIQGVADICRAIREVRRPGTESRSTGAAPAPP